MKLTTVISSVNSNPDYYNFLHTRFEKLAGPDWEKPTKLMTIAPKEIRLAIIDLECQTLPIDK